MTIATSAAEASAARWPGGLATRRPTGRPSWPLLFIEGGNEDGGTINYACAQLTASPRVGRAFWLDVGDGRQDDYAAVDGADYEVVVHDGSVRSIMAALDGVRQVAEDANAAGERPVVLIITMVGVWRLLSDWARARSVRNKAAQAKLREDRDADIEVSRHHRNDSYDMHQALVAALRRIPGIVVMTGRGHWVSPTDKAGQPVSGPREYVLDTHWGLGSVATLWLRLAGGSLPQVIALNSPVAARPGALPALGEDWSLEQIVFDVLRLDATTAAVPVVVAPHPDRSPEEIIADALNEESTWERLSELYREAEPLHHLVVTNEHRREEELGRMLARLAEQRAVSDPQVIDELGAALQAADTVAALHDVAGRVRSARSQGQVSLADRVRLEQAYKTRMAELRTQEQASQQQSEEVGS
ncbi:hypothetical protein ETD86_30065 [Nonomuraea turkmeniaca]|uniref:Uncharacterized protein n=1 Tax=Nonomuraea turkmeniaca TaxID=103838 RepID=A0A5S4F9T8_9ACTN|nr:hypothetical protein [Nonomuraea turkmeniaca]TMR13812.1 hypothetical protein ETD86_30065 [Nonomuraea turkmeniaca]